MATNKRSTSGSDGLGGRKPDADHNSGTASGGPDCELPKPQITAPARGSTGTALQRFAGRDDGWLRIAPDGDGNQCYCKWKFTCSRFPNKYVMVMCAWEDVLDGLELLEQKVEEVYLGMRRPVEDHWFSKL